MKKSMFFALAALGLVAMASCEKEAEKVKEPAPELTNETQITGIPFTGGEFTYEFDSNKKWAVAGEVEVTIEGQTYEFGLNPPETPDTELSPSLCLQTRVPKKSATVSP